VIDRTASVAQGIPSGESRSSRSPFEWNLLHMQILNRSLWVLLSLLTLGVPDASAKVVINEIMYHPPDDRDELQWIELHNTGDQAVNLAGWALVKGVRFTFTNSLSLPPNGFIVIARDRGAFVTHYPNLSPVVGDFAGQLSHGGERIELADPTQKTVDAVEFDDAPPWPTSPDGMSSSLERRIPTSPADDSSQWAPSPLPPVQGAAGTPGQQNAAHTTNLPPILRNLRFPSATPTLPKPVRILADLSDPDGVERCTLFYRVLPIFDPTSERPGSSPSEEETPLPMSRLSGDAQRGTYAAEIPVQPEGRLVRFRLEAHDRAGSVASLPHPHDAHPTWSVLSSAPTNSAAVPFAVLTQHGPAERPGQSIRTMDWSGRRSRRTVVSSEPSRGDATLVYIAPGTAEAQIFDHIRITPRQGGWKVRLQRDQLLNGMITVNVLFESQPRYVLAEHLAFETYRIAGIPTPLSGHWRTWYNGRPVGYHLFVEQPNSSFLRRVQRNPDGDLFKLIWYGGDLIGQHEKKNNPESGHAPLVEAVETLNKNRGSDTWGEIERRFNVPEFVNYYAVSMLIQNWDGFFNNYFLYRSPGADGQWEIIPWDEDKTWGDYDGASPQYDWYGMPLSYGMAGDQPKMKFAERFLGSSGPHGGQMWWRQPGWFSGPLLANPEFRKLFKARLRELLETEFTPEKMEPLFARMERALEPEIRYRATTVSARQRDGSAVDRNETLDASSPPQANLESSLERFQRHMGSFRRQVQFRREFLLKELVRERLP